MARIHLFLILLLLVNSSYALETLSHGSHQHGQEAISAQMEMHAQHGADHDMGQAASQADENCLCDDVCCLSTVQLRYQPDFMEDSSHPDAIAAVASFYKSISLDLTQPPPTS